MITLLYEYNSRGPGKVISNLKMGLQKLGIQYQENPKNLNKEDKVISLQFHPLTSQANPENLLLGPNVCVLPTDNQFMMSQNYKKCIVPSQHVLESYKRWIPEEKIKVWPVGIDVEHFNDKSKIEKQIDCLIYFKRRNQEELVFIQNFLKERNQTYELIQYGSYDEDSFINLISKSKYAIVIDNCESQGVAIQEMMSCNIPLMVWDVEYWIDRGEENKVEATSIPYWSKECGEKFYNKNELNDVFEKFISKLNSYSPREFILNNLTLEKQAEKIIKLFK